MQQQQLIENTFHLDKLSKEPKRKGEGGEDDKEKKEGGGEKE